MIDRPKPNSAQPERKKREPELRPTLRGGGKPLPRGRRPSGRLTEVEAFGPNPGALRMLAYAPPDLKPGAALVVVLHGCTQNAEGYDANAGWTTLADELGFAVLYPEQRAGNNPLGCFNWFLLADSARGLGETRSIHDMVETMIARHGISRGQIFVTGLSAGGAMTAALLRDYPEVFSAGAIIAGLPCGIAANVHEAYAAMTRPAERPAEDLGDNVRSGSPHQGPWPRVAVYHGAKDRTVSPRNAEELIKQWVDVHGGTLSQFREERDGGNPRRVWSVGGRDVVEATIIEGMDHGAPLDARRGEKPGPYMLDVGLSSTRRIATFFGLLDEAAERESSASSNREPARPSAAPRAPREQASSAPQPQLSGQNVIAAVRRLLKNLGLKT